MLLGEAELLRLLVDLAVRDGVLVLAHPLAKDVVLAAHRVLVLVVEDERRLELRVELADARRDGLLGRVDRPVVVVLARHDERGGLLGREHLRGARLDLFGELVVRLAVATGPTRGERVRAGGGLLALLAGALSCRLGRVLEDKGRELVLHVEVAALPARLAVAQDVLVLGDDELRLGVLARGAEDEFVDKGVEEIAKAGRVVRAVDDVSLSLVVERGLRAELAAEELGGVWSRQRALGHADRETHRRRVG